MVPVMAKVEVSDEGRRMGRGSGLCSGDSSKRYLPSQGLQTQQKGAVTGSQLLNPIRRQERPGCHEKESTVRTFHFWEWRWASKRHRRNTRCRGLFGVVRALASNDQK